MKFSRHDARFPFERLVVALRERARELGYALAVHGTLRRDIDLVAVPWVEEAADPRTLAESLRQVCALGCKWAAFAQSRRKGMQARDHNGSPGEKPHGRLTWVIYFGGKGSGGAYIDLSVMPRRAA